MPVKMLPLYLSYGGDTTDTIRFRKLTVEDVTLGLFSLGLTVNDPLDPPDPQGDDETDGVPGAAGAVGHGGGHHGGQGQHDDGTIKHLRAEHTDRKRVTHGFARRQTVWNGCMAVHLTSTQFDGQSLNVNVFVRANYSAL